MLKRHRDCLALWIAGFFGFLIAHSIKKQRNSDKDINTNDESKPDNQTKSYTESNPLVTKVQWSINSERNLTETIFNSRIHFFLLTITLIINALLNTKTLIAYGFILVFGFLLTAALLYSLIRTYIKVDEILKEVHDINNHPMHRIHEKAKCRVIIGYPAVRMIGVLIPLLCLIAFSILIVMAFCGVYLVDFNKYPLYKLHIGLVR